MNPTNVTYLGEELAAGRCVGVAWVDPRERHSAYVDGPYGEMHYLLWPVAPETWPALRPGNALFIVDGLEIIGHAVVRALDEAPEALRPPSPCKKGRGPST